MTFDINLWLAAVALVGFLSRVKGVFDGIEGFLTFDGTPSSEELVVACCSISGREFRTLSGRLAGREGGRVRC